MTGPGAEMPFLEHLEELRARLVRVVTALIIGHSLFVRDISIPKARILNDPDTPVCTVVAPRTEEAPPVVEEAAPAEPELIRKPKAEAEGEGEVESKESKQKA